jgi:hypothetical protein
MKNMLVNDQQQKHWKQQTWIKAPHNKN